jgi:hypothetical protein
MNDQERLEFAVKLAQTNLSEIRPGDLLNLRDDFQSFFAKPGHDMRGPIGEVVLPFAQPLPIEYTIKDFQELQKEVYKILNEIVAGRDTSMPSAPVCEITAKLIALSSPGMNGRSVLMAEGSTRDMFLLRLYLLLSREPVNRILRCKAPDCNEIFYRKRKQKYHSPRCQSRDFMRTFRKPKDSETAEKRSEENHKRYKARVEKSRGRPTKVARRQRRKAHGK